MCSTEQTLCQGLSIPGPTWMLLPTCDLLPDKEKTRRNHSSERRKTWASPKCEQLSGTDSNLDENEVLWTVPKCELNADSNQEVNDAESTEEEMKEREERVKSEEENEESENYETIRTPSPAPSDKSEECSPSEGRRTRSKSKNLLDQKRLSIKEITQTVPKYTVTILKGFDCPACDKSYKYKRDLDKHKKKHDHLKNAKPLYVSKGFDCNLCEKSYKHKQDLHRHKKITHKIPFEKHEDVISKSKGFDCPNCGSSYAYKKGLTRHLKHTCGQTGLLDCPICHKKLKQQFTLQDHLKVFHNDYYRLKYPPRELLPKYIEDPNNPSYVCHQCSKQYTYRKGLMRHLKLECGMEPQFQCHLCPKRIRRSQTLRKHMELKHGIAE